MKKDYDSQALTVPYFLVIIVIVLTILALVNIHRDGQSEIKRQEDIVNLRKRIMSVEQRKQGEKNVETRVYKVVD